jgi:hypothetical protein
MVSSWMEVLVVAVDELFKHLMALLFSGDDLALLHV